MYSSNQIHLIRVSAKRALDSGSISAERYEDILMQLELASKKQKKNSNEVLLREASKQLIHSKKLSYSL